MQYWLRATCIPGLKSLIYLLEVKTTTRACEKPFIISHNQFNIISNSFVFSYNCSAIYFWIYSLTRYRKWKTRLRRWNTYPRNENTTNSKSRFIRLPKADLKNATPSPKGKLRSITPLSWSGAASCYGSNRFPFDSDAVTALARSSLYHQFHQRRFQSSWGAPTVDIHQLYQLCSSRIGLHWLTMLYIPLCRLVLAALIILNHVHLALVVCQTSPILQTGWTPLLDSQPDPCRR
jgi:hypothetical protein